MLRTVAGPLLPPKTKTRRRVSCDSALNLGNARQPKMVTSRRRRILCHPSRQFPRNRQSSQSPTNLLVTSTLRPSLNLPEILNLPTVLTAIPIFALGCVVRAMSDHILLGGRVSPWGTRIMGSIRKSLIACSLQRSIPFLLDKHQKIVLEDPVSLLWMMLFKRCSLLSIQRSSVNTMVFRCLHPPMSRRGSMRGIPLLPLLRTLHQWLRNHCNRR